MKDQHELEKIVVQRLEEIKPAPPRDPHMVSRGRAAFLGATVSAGPLPRQKGWISIFRKERNTMNVLLSILVVAGLLLGGGATAVGAAQDDLPGEPLYAVKTWTEDFSLQFQADEEDKVDQLMELVRVRVQEMVQLSENGEPIPDEVPLRLEQHIQQALRLCVNMDDPTMEGALLQVRNNLQEQAQVMEQLQLRTQDPQAVEMMLQTRTMLQQRLQLVDQGLQNGEMFREQVQNGFQYGQEEDFVPPANDGNGQQNGGPDEAPEGPNTDPGGPNGGPGGPNPSPNPNPIPNPNPAPGGNGGNGNGSGSGGKP